MARTISAIPPGYPQEIVGYAEPWIASPGESVSIKISSTASNYTYRTVRLIQGVEDPRGPDRRIEALDGDGLSGQCAARFQWARPGSYAVVDTILTGESPDGLRISLNFQPWLLETEQTQTILALVGNESRDVLEISISPEQRLQIRVGSADAPMTLDYHLVLKEWLCLQIEISRTSVNLSILPIPFLGHHVSRPHNTSWELALPTAVPPSISLVLAAYRQSMHSAPVNYFNGRIEKVEIHSMADCPKTLLKLDFALKIPTNEVVDVSGLAHHGRLYQAPTRAVRGSDWDGSQTDWTKARYGYGAIHFHEDDLDDASWETDFVISVPENARSGAYAVEVQSTVDPTVNDSIVFFVRPHETSTARLALVASTFTYTAYANERMFEDSRSSKLSVPGDVKLRDDEDFRRMKRRVDLGLSLYDVHRDGSGSVFSTTKRPILNVRPNYWHWAFHRPREFSADLMMIGFLEDRGIEYDLLTDHQLHEEGVRALTKYSTVLTGCHPEYPSLESLNAYSAYTQRGGNLMYLGGNGFYWVSQIDPNNSHCLEVRRADRGLGTFFLPGGEQNFSTNGDAGGLWRSRGRSANFLTGLGSCGEGIGLGVAYKRTEKAHDPAYRWIFEGIPDGELLGEQGFGGGASGDEIDRWDPANGSPADAVVLASSIGHSDEFGLFPEDCGFPMVNTLGSQTDLIRSDIALFTTPGGGRVFSVGSINWYCSLAWDGYRNNIARLTENVIRRFLEV